MALPNVSTGLTHAPLAPAAAQRVTSGAGAVSLHPEDLERLLLAARSRPELAWAPDRHISEAANAHLTNTPDELEAALRGNYNFLEGDIRLNADGVPVMAHDSDQQTGLTLSDWFRIGKESERGLKADVKSAAALEPTIAEARAQGIDPRRLLMNVSAFGFDSNANVKPEQLALLRATYPDSLVNVSFSQWPYSPQALTRAKESAALVGKPVQFPLQADFVTPGVVADLKPHGTIGVWNNPHTYDPGDIPTDVARFRAMGVDGTIDLRPGMIEPDEGSNALRAAVRR